MDDVKLQLQTLLPPDLRNRPWIGDVTPRQHDVPAKEVIFRAGDIPQRLYFVARGWLRGATALTVSIRPLSTLYMRGSIIGLPWMTHRNHIEDVTAVTHTELISVSIKPFQEWVKQDTTLQAYIHDELVRDLIRMRMMNAVIGHMKAPDRLAYFLYMTLQQNQRAYQTTLNTLSLPMTQEEIGRLLGLTNVSVNRAFRVLENEGRIATARQTVTFLDKPWFDENFELHDRQALIDQIAGS
ncbi:MAG: Crp/Fnr family transcriptional regulator [Pseudomonadota bacterium]